MGCLKVTSLLLNKTFSAKAFLQNSSLSVKTELHNSLNVECSLVCSVSITPLIVIPREVQWITVENPVIYTIITKESWIVT